MPRFFNPLWAEYHSTLAVSVVAKTSSRVFFFIFFTKGKQKRGLVHYGSNDGDAGFRLVVLVWWMVALAGAGGFWLLVMRRRICRRA